MNPIPELTSVPPSLPRSSSFGIGRTDTEFSMSSSSSYSSSNGRGGGGGGFHAPRSASFPDSLDYSSNDGSYPNDHLFPTTHASRSASLNEGNSSFLNGYSSGPPSRSVVSFNENSHSSSTPSPSLGGGHGSRSASYTSEGALGLGASRWAPSPLPSSSSENDNRRPSVSTSLDPIVASSSSLSSSLSNRTDRTRSLTVPWSTGAPLDVGAIGERVGSSSSFKRGGIW
ncbi:hypothetical protein BDY24DRAFT_401335 [Mrakia frigida]|uniref:uncharacterized protein n=1 Tax=Mrakia frigida TaxID=29902 RepID=UPI003FCC0591